MKRFKGCDAIAGPRWDDLTQVEKGVMAKISEQFACWKCGRTTIISKENAGLVRGGLAVCCRTCLAGIEDAVYVTTLDELRGAVEISKAVKAATEQN